VFEAEVHTCLKNLLREQDTPSWPHHLTMARLVARALRLHRSTLIQTGTISSQYALSYLTPALLDAKPLLLVIPQPLQQRLLEVEIPQLQQWLETNKPIKTGDRWIPHFSGLFLTTPQAWLSDRLSPQPTFPQDLPTLIDPLDDLETWITQHLTTQITPHDWENLMTQFRQHRAIIRESRVKITKILFQHPPNPYQCSLIEKQESGILTQMLHQLRDKQPLSPTWENFYQKLHQYNYHLWGSLNRHQGQFTINCSPLEIASTLKKLWLDQTLILIGGFLDQETEATRYRQTVGLETTDLTCLKFAPNRQNDSLRLYLPEGLPLPNTPQFQNILKAKIRKLINFRANIPQPIVILIGDLPLKHQIAAEMASEFGSRVQLETTNLSSNGILVSSWEFWRNHQQDFPDPHLLIITTLPIPSLENPLVAAKVSYYKQQHLDWFRLYLLPTALKEIQRAVIPLRQSQGIIVLLDNRVNHRSYGVHILDVLTPYNKINYLDSSWFE
jgi:ATP-dependent DNA helicase DinG